MVSVRLHRQICAFIDVLGGAQLFRGKDKARARDFFSCLTEFERRLNGWSHHFPKKRRSASLVKTFSDNIFVAFPFASSSRMSNEDVVSTFIAELKHQIYEMTLIYGFPVRGAISVGSLMFTDKFLFGPALVEAVELEKSAIFPRVLVSDSTLRYLKPDSSSLNLILRDADGCAFLHYLHAPPVLGPILLKRHREYVQRGLIENTNHIRERQKYEWLVQYHNFVASNTGYPELAVSTGRDGAFCSLEF